MADDNIQRPPGRPDQATTAEPPAAAPLPGGGEGRRPVDPARLVAPHGRSELERLLRWLGAAVLVIALGNGLVIGAAYVAHTLGAGRETGALVVLAAWAASFGLFYLLEKDGWLNRVIGLQTTASPSPGQRAGRAFVLSTFGTIAVVYLLLHSTSETDPTAAKAAAREGAKVSSEVSSTREIVETVVFVVVLVLLLKSFVAEAFVIPTGSMATTLYGYQKMVTCPKCGYEFPVNCSQEVDPQDGDRVVVRACTCPNCRLTIPMAKKERVERRDREGRRFETIDWVPLPQFSANTGDRVLVGKFLYDLPWNPPEKNRLNVVVFKYPERPQKDFTPMNYIKRLVGLPGETIGIYYGKVYVLSPDKGLRYDDSAVPPLDRWRYDNMHVNDPQARERWDKGEFQILRRPPDVVMAERRIVYDGEHPVQVPGYLQGIVPPRWAADGSGWAVPQDRPTAFEARPGGADGVSWLRYRHVLFWKTYCALLVRHSPTIRQWAQDRAVEDREDRNDFGGDPSAEGTQAAALEHHYVQMPEALRQEEQAVVSKHAKEFADAHEFRPELVTDFMGYNSYEPQMAQPAQHWVGDLMVECDVKIEKPQGQLVLELSRGTDRFRAAFDLATGECTLRRVKDYVKKEAPPDDAGEVLATKPTDLKKSGTYHVRFANVDNRLLLWVDRSMPFGEEGQAYEGAREPGPYANDLQPASVGVRGASLNVSKLQLWRDTYYTQMQPHGGDVYPQVADYSDPDRWDALRTEIKPMTLYVQPGHYPCMGDNSPHSSDGRAWGLVPERLMLGRALVVYYPFPPLGEKRIGPIH